MGNLIETAREALQRHGADLSEQNEIVRNGRGMGVYAYVRHAEFVLHSSKILAVYPLDQIGAGTSQFVERFFHWSELK